MHIRNERLLTTTIGLDGKYLVRLTYTKFNRNPSTISEDKQRWTATFHKSVHFMLFVHRGHNVPAGYKQHRL